MSSLYLSLKLGIVYLVERLYCKRPILWLASSKILTPHPPRGEDTLAGWRGGGVGGGSIFWKTQDTALYSTVGAKNIARRHSTYVIMPKKPKFQTFLFGKIKKEEFARRFFEKNSVFSSLKLLNKHCSKMIFFYQCFASSLLWRRRNFADSNTEF
jgi:hypothetical protein